MNTPTVPAGVALLLNLVRIGRNELAKSYLFHVQTPTEAGLVAAAIGAKAAALTDSDAGPELSLVITLNLVDGSGRGGVSWQCLTFSRRVDRDALASAVADVVSGMVWNSATTYLCGPALPGTPAPNAPTSHEVQ